MSLCAPWSPWQPASLPYLSCSLSPFVYFIPGMIHITFDKQFVCLSLPPQDTQSIGVLPDDSESVLMDDTSSQWSAAADTEEERKSALEKSMYVFQTSLNLCPMAIRAVVHSLNKCVVSNSNIFKCSCS